MSGTSTKMVETDLTQDSVSCSACRQSVPLYEVFDAWEIPGADREACPRCAGVMLCPLIPA